MAMSLWPPFLVHPVHVLTTVYTQSKILAIRQIMCRSHRTRTRGYACACGVNGALRCACPYDERGAYTQLVKVNVIDDDCFTAENYW